MILRIFWGGVCTGVSNSTKIRRVNQFQLHYCVDPWHFLIFIDFHIHHWRPWSFVKYTFGASLNPWTEKNHPRIHVFSGIRLAASQLCQQISELGVLPNSCYGGGFKSHRIHVWYIYLHEWLILMVNVGKYTIHGSYGNIFYFHPENWGNDPIWLSHIFSDGWEKTPTSCDGLTSFSPLASRSHKLSNFCSVPGFDLVILGLSPLPVTVANEGLVYRDPLLKM